MTKIYRQIPVSLDGVSYQILIGRDLLDSVGDLIAKTTNSKNVIIVSDIYFADNLVSKIIGSLQKKGFNCIKYFMTAGKHNKNFNEILKIYGVLEENNFSRDSTLIALGGGVIGDLCGFVASTWLRGMNLIHIPTTLLAAVDSSIGGKTAINFRKTINGIGSYYHPRLNLIDLNLIDSLSKRDYCSGLAEVIKCAIIDDKLFYDYLENNYIKIFRN